MELVFVLFYQTWPGLVWPYQPASVVLWLSSHSDPSQSQLNWRNLNVIKPWCVYVYVGCVIHGIMVPWLGFILWEILTGWFAISHNIDNILLAGCLANNDIFRPRVTICLCQKLSRRRLPRSPGPRLRLQTLWGKVSDTLGPSLGSGGKNVNDPLLFNEENPAQFKLLMVA